MRGNMLQARSLTAALDYIPHNILRDTFPPHFPRSRDCPKDPPLCDPGCACPLIKRRFYPFWDRHRADVSTLPDQIHRCPVPLAHLDLIQFQADQLRSAEATTEQHGQHRVVSLGTHAMAASVSEYFGTLLCAQPVAGPEPELLDPFNAADPCCQFGTEQAGIGGFMGEAAHGGKLLVDGVCSQAA